MSRKKSLSQVDDEGYLTDGMERWRPKQTNEVTNPFTDWEWEPRQTWADRIAAIRAQICEKLSPYWKGPLSDDQVNEVEISYDPPEVNVRRIVDGQLAYINAGNGNCCYQLVEEAARPGWVNDALVALCHADLLEMALKNQHGDDAIITDAIKLGQTIERIRSREQFAEFVLSEKGRRKGRHGTGAILSDSQLQVVKEFIAGHVGKSHNATKACEAASTQLRTGVLKGMEGTRVEISVKCLRNLWSRRNK